MKILVTGSTGTVGSAVLKELLRRGADVRVLVRDASKSKAPGGVEVAVGDMLDPAAVRAALGGADKLYLLNAVVADELTQGVIAVDLARRAKVRHVVYHSVFRPEKFLDVAHFASKFTIETALRQFDVPFTAIRPNYFFQNDARLRDIIDGKGMYPTPLGTSGVSAVDVRDIAEATVVALTTDGHEGKAYNLVGPAPVSGPAAAAVWGRLLGREVRYPGEDLDAWEAQMRQTAPPWMAYDMRMMFQGYLERGSVAGDGDVETLTRLLGHPPRAYEDFARETATAWKQ